MKRILYYAPGTRSHAACIERLRAESELELVVETVHDRVLERLSREFVHLLLLDLRGDDSAADARGRAGF